MSCPFVSLIQDGRLTVVGADRDLSRALVSLGGRRSVLRPSRVTFRFSGDADLARVAVGLRDKGVAFAGGMGWPPSEVVADLRAKGLLAGSIVEIVWLGPGKSLRREK